EYVIQEAIGSPMMIRIAATSTASRIVSQNACQSISALPLAFLRERRIRNAGGPRQPPVPVYIAGRRRLRLSSTSARGLPLPAAKRDRHRKELSSTGLSPSCPAPWRVKAPRIQPARFLIRQIARLGRRSHRTRSDRKLSHKARNGVKRRPRRGRMVHARGWREKSF